jgi:rod shape-determining protein MreC
MRERKLFYRIFLIVIFLIIVIILNHIGALEPIKNPISKIFTSAGTRQTSVNTSSFISTLFSVQQVIEENSELKGLELKIESVKQENIQLLKENETLRKQLQLLPKFEFDLAVSEIVGTDPNSSEEIIIINKGEADGIRAGMPVIINDKVFVGEVYEAFKNRSKIILSVSPLSKFDASFQDNNLVVAATGAFNLEIRLSHIPNKYEINENSIVITGGREKNFPEGLLVGKIIKTEQSSDGLFKESIVQPFYSINELKFVSVIVGRKERPIPIIEEDESILIIPQEEEDNDLEGDLDSTAPLETEGAN